MIVGQGMTLTLAGRRRRTARRRAGERVLATLLFGVSRLDPATYAGVIVVMLGVAAIACWLPARRAALVDPAITLRAE